MIPPTISNSHESPSASRLFKLKCVDVHSVNCDFVLGSENPHELVVRAREHGERVHGFTPTWYGAERLTAMWGAVRVIF